MWSGGDADLNKMTSERSPAGQNTHRGHWPEPECAECNEGGVCRLLSVFGGGGIKESNKPPGKKSIPTGLLRAHTPPKNVLGIKWTLPQFESSPFLDSVLNHLSQALLHSLLIHVSPILPYHPWSHAGLAPCGPSAMTLTAFAKVKSAFYLQGDSSSLLGHHLLLTCLGVASGIFPPQLLNPSAKTVFPPCLFPVPAVPCLHLDSRNLDNI